MLRIRDHHDEHAWDTFLNVYSPLIYNFCRGKGLQASDAADITQEVLLRVANAIRKFEYDRSCGMFRDWLARIVSNEVRRHYVKRKEQVLPPEFDASGADEMWDEYFHQHLFKAAMSRCRPHFTDDTWTLFEQSWIKKIPAKQVAEEFQVGIESVYVARSRVLKRLRREVAILADDI